MNYFQVLIITVLLLLFGKMLEAQNNDSAFFGKVDGVVKDSTHNFVLKAATIAIYQKDDSSLLAYQLSNNLGEFILRGLPTGRSLQAVFSYVGYRQVSKSFVINAADKVYHLKIVNLDRSDQVLETVVVTAVPPVRMNKDTLEFNADAFKLNKNAVVEDLMRKLPGITIWADGTITFNGRPVNGVLVEGKPFFGGNTTIATRNLPKSAVDKVQVYKQNEDSNNPFDSTIGVNIKLKKNKKSGVFGKIGGGYGTNDRFEADGGMNLYNPVTQLGVVASANNTNKLANGTNMLMDNNTFKGAGPNTVYQSDFEMSGLNQFKSGGLVYQHDFIPDANFYKNNRVNANYFVSNTKSDRLSARETDIYTGSDTLTGRGNSLYFSNSTSQNLNGFYNVKNSHGIFSVLPLASMNESQINSLNVDSSFIKSNGLNELQSCNSVQSEVKSYNDNLGVTATYQHRPNTNPLKGAGGNFNVKVIFTAGSSNEQKMLSSKFYSLANPIENRKISRKYDNNSENLGTLVDFDVRELQKLLFNYKNPLGFDVAFSNRFANRFHNGNDLVLDFDERLSKFLINPGQTNKLRYASVEESPALIFSKRKGRSLINRYSKLLSISAEARVQFLSQSNFSERQAMQNFNRGYQKFIPQASIEYQNNQFGDFINQYNFDFKTIMEYPKVDQLFQLADSSNWYFARIGNPNLGPSEKRELAFRFQHVSQKKSNPWSYVLNFNAGVVNNVITDSSVVNRDGRTLYYFMNASSQKYAVSGLDLRKAFRFENSSLQINVSSYLNFYQTPNKVNGVLNKSDIYSNGNTLNLDYSYKDFWALSLAQSLFGSHSIQKGAGTIDFGSKSQRTKVSASVNLTNRVALNTNATYTYYAYSGSMAASGFTLWNASATYRFLKSNAAEVKFSAMDLLHQNTGIMNQVAYSSLSHSSVNALQQYFMVTLSYFPRQFGRKLEK